MNNTRVLSLKVQVLFSNGYFCLTSYYLLCNFPFLMINNIWILSFLINAEILKTWKRKVLPILPADSSNIIIRHHRCIQCSLMAKPEKWLMRVTDIKFSPTETSMPFIYKSIRHLLQKKKNNYCTLSLKTIHFLFWYRATFTLSFIISYLLFKRVLLS